MFAFDGKSMQAGSSLPYAGSLATGGTGPFGEAFPARDPREVTSAQLDELRARIYDWFRSKYEVR